MPGNTESRRSFVSDINWANPTSHMTPHFTVHEATYLPSWRIHHLPTEAEQAEILLTAQKMEDIRIILGKPIIVTCWIRPESTSPLGQPSSPYRGRSYNRAVPGAALHSAHIPGMAVDFVVPGMTCDAVRDILRPRLTELGICLEDMKGYGWVHIDRYPPERHGGRRDFRV